MGDVLAFGEALMDLISTQVVSSLADAGQFQRFVGGEVTNVALNIARLGGRSAVVACVGDDGFGRYIRRQLEAAGVTTDGLLTTSQAPTTMAINARQTMTPDFIIYRGADAYIRLEEAHKEAIRTSRVVHTSAFALSREPARTAVLQALEFARQCGCLISLDPNYHARIWPDVANFQDRLREAYRFVNITKPSLDDSVRLFGPGLTPVAYAKRFLRWGPELVALTMGKQGVLLATNDDDFYHIKPGHAEVADVTGAGDAFWAGLLTALLDGYPPPEAACFGQMVAEAKIGTVGPVSQLPDRALLYRQLETIKGETITEPPQTWMAD
ncbi:MAG: sugar kinase [Chloroflexi bacterium]|nr:sugar kinase [Chloroflexota bacterium]